MNTAKMRYCFNCGAELEVIESRFYDRSDMCGDTACLREARYQAEAERDEAHHELDRLMGWDQ